MFKFGRLGAASVKASRRQALILQAQHRQFGTSPFLSEKLYDKVLIANRGEIACRVIRTCKKLGIKTVAIHSDVDANSLHVKEADEAVLVGPAPSAQSYLNMDNILSAIKKTGAQAVHPGYGFLSENMQFAQTLQDNNIDFIGPNTYAIEAMGDKIESKIVAKKAGVNTIPGFDGEIETIEEALKISNEITYPVMVKASAGGGGKGMRIAWNDAECKEAFTLCKQEAKASFGDDRLLIEKFIDDPRHIEIQVMADKHGNAVYLNERECSVQRRNQKVVEEAPSVFLDDATRKAMGEQAIMLAKAVNYDSAGTVEFLVDSQRNFYFLEMNTRLQVEHPITEYITKVDLVEQMLRSASGKELNLKQSDIGIHGWAIESRVYAEDPTKMLPSIGYLEKYIQPVDIDGDESVRVDTGVVEGSEISIYYDPMICKLITYGKDRETALDKMEEALDTYYIKGVQHNIPLLRDIITADRFRSGNINTKYIAEEYPEGFQGIKLQGDDMNKLAIASTYMKLAEQIQSSNFTNLSTNTTTSDASSVEFTAKILDQEIATSFNPKTMELSVNGQVFVMETPLKDILQNYNPIVNLTFTDKASGATHRTVAQLLNSSPSSVNVSYKGSHFNIDILDPRIYELAKLMPEVKAVDTTKLIVAPMPGAVVSIGVSVGEKVGEGQEVAVVEAMKMQNSLRALKSGVVKAIHVKPGDSVSVDEVLIEFADDAEE